MANFKGHIVLSSQKYQIIFKNSLRKNCYRKFATCLSPLQASNIKICLNVGSPHSAFFCLLALQSHSSPEFQMKFSFNFSVWLRR
jgi:hypothetical protein